MSSYFLSGQIIHIPVDYETIQLGIDAANNGDTILVDTGLYVENIDFLGKNIKLGSHYILTMDTNYIYQTIIDGDSSGTVVSIINCEDSTTQLTGFTIRNGADTLGGGIIIENSNVKISNCIITNNVTYANGGGIYCNHSNPDISYCKISDNRGYELPHIWLYGIGVYLTNSGGSITNSIVTNNRAHAIEGIGIYHNNSTTYLENMEISYNNGAYHGGGLSIYAKNKLVFNNLHIKGNGAVLGGGVGTGGNLTLTNSIIENNHQGGFYLVGNLTLINCTVIENRGDHYGSGVFNATGVLYLYNTIFSNNTPNEIILRYNQEINAEAYLSYSNLYPNGVGGMTGFAYYLEGNINTDPMFSETGDYYYMLRDESACVNSGTPDTSGLNLPKSDIAGNNRIYGGRIDMGAYENQNVTIGIAEYDYKNFSIEPNPFHNGTFLRYHANNKTNVVIDLFDLTGRKIKNICTGLTISENDKLPVNTNGLEKGIYILVIRTGKAVISRKIIKE